MKFKKNGIISLLEMNRRHNLAESTACDMYLKDIASAEILERMMELKLGYGSSKGNEELKELLAAKLHISRGDILITSGAINALMLCLLCLPEAGDEIISINPSFPCITNLIDAAPGTSVTVCTSFDQDYRPDPDELTALLNVKTKIVLICSPQNPSGRRVERETIQRILSIMEDKCPLARLIIDETYRDAAYGEEPTEPSLAGLSGRMLTLSSLSKGHGAPGIRVGWLTCTDKALMEELINAKLNTGISCSVVDEFLAVAILKKEHEVLTHRKQLLKEAVQLMSAWIEQNQQYVEWVKPDAGGLCCVRLRAAVFKPHHLDYFRENLSRVDLQLGMGEWFGEPSNVFRIGFGYLAPAELQKALEVFSMLMQETLSHPAKPDIL